MSDWIKGPPTENGYYWVILKTTGEVILGYYLEHTREFSVPSCVSHKGGSAPFNISYHSNKLIANAVPDPLEEKVDAILRVIADRFNLHDTKCRIRHILEK